MLPLKLKENLVQFAVLFHMEVLSFVLCLLVHQISTSDHNDWFIACRNGRGGGIDGVGGGGGGRRREGGGGDRREGGRRKEE